MFLFDERKPSTIRGKQLDPGFVCVWELPEKRVRGRGFLNSLPGLFTAPKIRGKKTLVFPGGPTALSDDPRDESIGEYVSLGC